MKAKLQFMVWGSRGSRGSGAPKTLKCKWTGKMKWSGFQKAKKFIFQMSILPMLWISNVSYDVNIMKRLELLFESFLKSLEFLNFMLGWRRTNEWQPIVRKNLEILG